MEKYLDFVSIPPDLWSLIFTWINLLILFLIVRRFLFKPVREILDRRSGEVGDIYRRAEEAEAQAASMEAEYTKKLLGAKNEADRILQEAEIAAHEQGRKIIGEARASADGLLRRAREQIDRERREAEAGLRTQAAAMAVAIAEKLLEKELDPVAHARLIDSFISGGVENP